MNLALLRRRQSFLPTSLFRSGAEGVWFDPSDLSTMYQDDAGATPVTAAGDPVGLILDKSGNGNHATQGTAGQRPTLRNAGGLWYLEFDGTNDALATGAIDFSASDKIAAFVALRKDSDAAIGTAVELSANVGTNDGSFVIQAPHAVTDGYRWRSKGTSITNVPITGYAAPITNVITGIGDISGDSAIIRVDGAEVSSGAGDQGSGNFGNYPLYIGGRGGSGVPFTGNIYGLVVTGGAQVAAQIVRVERYLAARSGVFI